jgi:hypothetical protein
MRDVLVVGEDAMNVSVSNVGAAHVMIEMIELTRSRSPLQPSSEIKRWRILRRCEGVFESLSERERVCEGLVM